MEIHGGGPGRVLHIDLTARKFSRIPLPDDGSGPLTGGKALAARLLLDFTSGGETALSEEAPAVIAAGVLTGTGAPAAARFDLAALSPKDGLPAFSNSGGGLGIRLKRAGFDALVLTGRCESPQWLQITDGAAIFHDARDLWGLETDHCREVLCQLQPDVTPATLCIGPAGEHLVKYASVRSDGHSTGRAGFGAVLGFKGLKALTVSGTGAVLLHDPEGARRVLRRWNAQLGQSAPASPGEGRCGACPLRCPRPRQQTAPLPDSLGLDAMETETAVRWAQAQGMDTADLVRRIAHREGIGDRLADGVPGPKSSGSRRKAAGFSAIRDAFSPPGETAGEFCRNLTEAVSVCGQCVFTLNALSPGGEFFLPELLEAVTGQPVTLEALLSLGRYSRNLEAQLRERFTK